MKTPGSYLLTVKLAKTLTMPLGKRTITLDKGWYCYAGSALGGLQGRVSRHLRVTKPRHWHIDYLLASGTVMDLQMIPSTDPLLECQLAAICFSKQTGIGIPGFGSTDCRCKSHLYYFKDRPQLSIHEQCTRLHLDKIMEVLHETYEEHASYDRDPFHTLVTCILSLRTRDPETFKASESLLSVLSIPSQFASASIEEVASLISNVGMYKQKAARLIEMSQMILSDFGGQVPSDIDALLTLPGVGRKTANLVRSFSFHLPAICVDTHVHRICNRMGLIRTADADSSEFALRNLLPERHWLPLNPLMVQHGQQVCKPHRPSCGACPISRYCAYSSLVEEDSVRQAIKGAPPHPSLTRIPTPNTTDARDEKWLSPFEKRQGTTH